MMPLFGLVPNTVCKSVAGETGGNSTTIGSAMFGPFLCHDQGQLIVRASVHSLRWPAFHSLTSIIK